MKKSLSHLPKRKRDELQRITKLIRVKLPAAEMIILFGSHARGDWVEDLYTEGHITYEYQSDFDVLVIVDSPGMVKSSRRWHRMENDLGRLLLRTPISLIGEDIEFVNRKLERAHYFFSDIKKEGIMLFDSGKFKLARCRKLDPAERARIAKEDFEQWFESATDFYEQYKFALSRRKNKIAAFELHQATERFYAAIMLVFTGYKPKTHDIEKLDRQAGNHDPAFLPIFPRATQKQKHRFDLLKRAYIDARYKKDYKITATELKWLADRVKHLQDTTKATCKKHIRKLKGS